MHRSICGMQLAGQSSRPMMTGAGDPSALGDRVEEAARVLYYPQPPSIFLSHNYVLIRDISP
jgi:hypothetical protein